MLHRKAVDRIFGAAEKGDIDLANRLFRQAIHDARSGKLKPRSFAWNRLALCLALLLICGMWVLH